MRVVGTSCCRKVRVRLAGQKITFRFDGPADSTSNKYLMILHPLLNSGQDPEIILRHVAKGRDVEFHHLAYTLSRVATTRSVVFRERKIFDLARQCRVTSSFLWRS